jgi:hypothetical protein
MDLGEALYEDNVPAPDTANIIRTIFWSSTSFMPR